MKPVVRHFFVPAGKYRRPRGVCGQGRLYDDYTSLRRRVTCARCIRTRAYRPGFGL